MTGINPSSKLEHELRYSTPFIATLAITTATGLATFVTPQMSFGVWQQWTVLIHLLSGVALTVLILPYLLRHFIRTMGVRRPSVFLIGLLSSSTLLFLIGSGVYITWQGQREDQRWIIESHIWVSIGAVVLMLMHLVSHRLIKHNNQSANRHVVLHKAARRQVLASVLITACCISLASFIYESSAVQFTTEPVIKPYQLPYGDHPFAPSLAETDNRRFIDERQIGDSEDCGTCHSDIFEQWQRSMHARAASDKTYQTNINLLAENKGMASTRYCEGCHAPVALLTGQLTEGGRLDTKGHLEEGVGCLSCHGISHAVNQRGVGSYHYRPASEYLFGGSENDIARSIRHLLINVFPHQHRKDMDRPVMSTPELCATCHVQFMDKDMNDWGWIKMQDEYSSWLNSPYSGQTQQDFAQGQVTRCQDCHFPLIEAADPSADSDGKVFAHHSPGANTAIPWHLGDQQQLADTIAFLSADKMRLSIDVPERFDALRSEIAVNPITITSAEYPSYIYLGEQLQFKVVVSNTGVGHHFPGGTTDINQAWLHVRAVDGQGHVIYETGMLDKDGRVEPEAYFYESIPIDRTGKHVWRHDLFNMVGDSYSRTIPPAESDIIDHSVKVPSWAKSPISISATLRYRKLNLRYAKWALQRDDVAELPIVDMAYDIKQIPVLMRPRLSEAQPPATPQ